MIPVSLRHEDSEVLEANCTITKDYQIISGDESFYRMIGENTMFLMNKLIYPDDLNIFEDWKLVDYFSEHLKGKSEKSVDIPKR